jgi:hypothetical protein
MSETFKFLKAADGDTSGKQNAPNAAQDFLSKQLDKNKYTTGDPYAAGEGVIPGGEGYDDQRVVKNQAEIDAWHKANPDGPTTRAAAYAPTGTEGYVHNYKASGSSKEGKSSKGKKIEDFYQGEELNALRDYTAGLGKDPYAYGFADKDSVDLTQRGEMEGKLQKIGQHLGYNNRNLDTGHIRDFVMRGEEPQVEVDGPPEAQYEMTPIEHSPEIKQAKERVKTYEEDVKSGKTSKEVHDDSKSFVESLVSDDAPLENIATDQPKASDKYTFDSSKGINALGSMQSKQDSSTAAQSFLENKVFQVKKNLSPV